MTKRGITPEQAKKNNELKGLKETNLQRIRVKKGLSQNDLSIIAGVTKRAIQCYEQRTRNIDGAKLETLCDLSIALGCKVSDLLEDEKLIERYKVVK